MSASGAEYEFLRSDVDRLVSGIQQKLLSRHNRGGVDGFTWADVEELLHVRNLLSELDEFLSRDGGK